nr:MAG TPA: hypothetical protein [Caudoviricetes sp.]DAV73112.1 MAG TPA: hypothetical protein [Caudoviricetes sp.]DAZ64123.1 MAG TPA: hypothetical protein [Caudoviricetes sp.]
MWFVLVCAFIILSLGWRVKYLIVNNYHKIYQKIYVIVVHIAITRPCL